MRSPHRRDISGVRKTRGDFPQFPVDAEFVTRQIHRILHYSFSIWERVVIEWLASRMRPPEFAAAAVKKYQYNIIAACY